MKILVIGQSGHFDECQKKFGAYAYTLASSHLEAEVSMLEHDVIFDFIIDTEPDQFRLYAENPLTAFLNTCNTSLSSLAKVVNHQMQSTIFGFNGLPTMVSRNVLEVCVLHPRFTGKLIEICTRLKTEYLLVDDRVGLVTPRVVCMIINEAFYAVQEGTASREDVDLAMKLGMNFPYGPFEWCNRIGVSHVYRLLNAIYDDTQDPRYKICPLLKKEYLSSTGS